jgi:hypothetical protein
MGTETPIFLFWEYLFRNFSILSLQRTKSGPMRIQYKCLFPIYAFPEMKLLEMEIRTEAAQFPEKLENTYSCARGITRKCHQYKKKALYFILQNMAIGDS